MEMVELIREDKDAYKTAQLLYSAAIKKIVAKIEILNEEFQQVHNYNPIEYVKSRVKTDKSIREKIERKGLELTLENIVTQLDDLAGVRIVCSFIPDIYKMANMIGAQSDLTVLSVKDYIKNPKESGYKSFHMNVKVPIFLSDRVVNTQVEIQIRTIAMDFWASLEHKIYYKFEGNAPEYISRELRECAGIVSMMDDKMFALNTAIMEEKAKMEQEIKNKDTSD
ncbi:putative GTP pyrophosphokinase [Lachnospiraceae bacterium XBB1006]|nr:putative GTP pyrophosphokinase [Lachnospiraceae bacterium XBB1006]